MSFDLNPKESNLESYLRKEAAIHGWEVIKCGFDGWPDDVVVADFGVVGWIELKRYREPVTPRQQLRIEDLQRRGQLATAADTRAQVRQFILVILERVRKARGYV